MSSPAKVPRKFRPLNLADLSYLPGAGFAGVFLLVVLVWKPFSGSLAPVPTYDPLAVRIESQRAEALAQGRGKDRDTQVAALRRHRELLAVGVEPTKLPEVGTEGGVPTAAVPAPTPEVKTPAPKSSTPVASAWVNRRADGLLAVTVTLMGIAVSLGSIAIGLIRMYRGLQVGHRKGRMWATVGFASCVVLLVLFVPSTLGPLGLEPVPSLNLWTASDPAAALGAANTEGHLVQSLIASRDPTYASFVHLVAAVGLCAGYAASIVLLGAFGATLVQPLGILKSYGDGKKSAGAEELGEAIARVGRSRAEFRSVLYVVSALFVTGVISQFFYRTHAVTFLPPDRDYLRDPVSRVIESQNLSVALIYTLFMAASYLPSALLLQFTADRLHSRLAALSPTSTTPPALTAAGGDVAALPIPATGPTPSLADDLKRFLGILQQLLPVIAPILCDIFLRLIGVVSPG